MNKHLVGAILTFSLAASALSAQDRGLAVLARQVTGRPDFDVGKQYAVIIGIDKYREWNSLRGAVSEAKAVKKVLGDRYYIDDFFELYDGDATAAKIRRLFIETLPAKIGPRDSLLVFFAGHGQTDATKTGFWIASDGSKDLYQQNNWIPNAQVRNMVASLRAQRVLILADACFAGDFLNVNRGATPVIDSAYYSQALQLVSRQVLTSGASQSVPDDSEFGKQLVSFLERNTEPLLDTVSIYERVRRGIGQSLPLLGTLPGNEDGASFVLFLKPEADRASAEAKAPKATEPKQAAAKEAEAAPAVSAAAVARAPVGRGDLMVRTNPAGAEVFVDGVSYGPAPALVTRLEADKTVKVSAKTDSMAGSLDVTLQAGEVKEVEVELSTLTGNLFLRTNKADAHLLVDGQDLGEVGSGLFRGVIAGKHKLEVVTPDMYGTAMTRLIPGETTEVEIVLRPGITKPDDWSGTVDIGASYIPFSIDGTSIIGGRISIKISALKWLFLFSDGGIYAFPEKGNTSNTESENRTNFSLISGFGFRVSFLPVELGFAGGIGFSDEGLCCAPQLYIGIAPTKRLLLNVGVISVFPFEGATSSTYSDPSVFFGLTYRPRKSGTNN
jgi:hypothetical protein